MRRHEVWLLLALTALGAGLRFFMLDQPAVWGDEAATWTRVCGSWGELLHELRRDAFLPIHYELYWLLHQWLGSLSAFSLRVIPAVAGTLTVPAVWWVARQLLGPRVALAAAFLTATSAYLLVYSRDAKMYALLWMLVTLHAGCVLAWVRTRDRLWWWAWVLTGVAMLGVHATAAFALVLDALVILSTLPRRRAWLPIAAAFVGVAIMGLGPLRHYGIGEPDDGPLYVRGFSDPMTNADPNPNELGIGWVSWYHAGREPQDMVLMTASAYLTGWEWPAPERESVDEPPRRRRGGFLASMALPSQDVIPTKTRRALKTGTLLILGGLALGVFPWRRRWTGLSRHFRTRFGAGRTFLWLGTWSMLPIVLVFCLSFGDRPPRDLPEPITWQEALARPWELFAAERWAILHPLLTSPWFLGTLGVIALGWLLASGASHRVRWARSWRFGFAAGVLVALMVGVAYATAPKGQMVWMPRYVGVCVPGIMIVAGWLLMRVPTVPLRVFVASCWLATNMGQFAGRLLMSEPPVDVLAADVIAATENERVGVYLTGDHDFSHPAPAGGWANTWPFSFYLLNTDPLAPDHAPPDLRGRAAFALRARVVLQRYGEHYPIRNSDQRLAREADDRERVILWHAVLPDRDPVPLPPLPENFDVVSDRTYRVFDHWRWNRVAELRRVELEKQRGVE